ncbi:hypothetical protein AB0K15_29995 [Amycolatopsis sp. NPDC049253]|uniref:hypothetical protein n=1 Tax=Amycolatopsis sp. NPDC049253 TaxID=3155274 RepID=UPI003431D44D
MRRLTVLYRPLAPEHFRECCVTTHLPLVAKLPGLLRFDVHQAVIGLSWSLICLDKLMLN